MKKTQQEKDIENRSWKNGLDSNQTMLSELEGRHFMKYKKAKERTRI